MPARQLGHHQNSGSHCPHGYSGDDCSVKVTKCGAERSDLVHSCYYGSSCVDASNDFGLLDRYCECGDAEELAAGLMCEYKATSICIAGDDKEQVTDQYCVNGGVCIAFVGPEHSHPGCVCEVGTYEGKHCEFTHGVLLDDALDLFQQRKAEIASEKSMNRAGPSTTINHGEEGENESFPLSFVVGSFVAIFAVINLSAFGLWKMTKKNKPRSNDTDYQSVGLGSIATKATNSSHDNSMPPPANVFLPSRKKEVESSDPGSSLMMSPGNDTDIGDDRTNYVEELDAETSRMIESQFKSCEMNSEGEGLDLDSPVEDQEELVFPPSYESDDRNGDQGHGLVHSGRITINSGKNPLSKLQDESLSDEVVNSLVVDDETVMYENEESMSLSGHVSQQANGVVSMDGEYDDDSDEDNYFV